MTKSGTTKNIKTGILLAALPDVPFDGWGDAVLTKAAARLKISDAALKDAFPRGAEDLAVYFSEWADAEMLKRMTPAKMKNMRVSEKITFGVRSRLEILAPYKAAAGAALTFMAAPPRGLQLPKMVWRTADKIWWAAGDTATDYNHYTKRGLLSGVLTATGLYWLNDSSEDHENTWAFLDRRIENVLKIGRKISGFRKKA